MYPLTWRSPVPLMSSVCPSDAGAILRVFSAKFTPPPVPAVLADVVSSAFAPAVPPAVVGNTS